jgi:hypothetical protein
MGSAVQSAKKAGIPMTTYLRRGHPGVMAHKAGRIQMVGYDPVTGTLEVRWESGEVERYFGVPQEVYEELYPTPSREQFVRKTIQQRYPREPGPFLWMGDR